MVSVDTKRLVIRLDDDLHTALTELAKREDRSLNSLMVHLLRQAVETAKASSLPGLSFNIIIDPSVFIEAAVRAEAALQNLSQEVNQDETNEDQ